MDQFYHDHNVGGSGGGGRDKVAKSKSPQKKKKEKKSPKKAEKAPKEMKKRGRKKKTTEKETTESIETSKPGNLVIPGSPIIRPPPTKTKYITELYTGSKELADHDLFEVADMEHQHRKLNEALNELMDPGAPNLLQHEKLSRIFGNERKAREAKLTADRRVPALLLASAKVDLGVERLPALGPNTYPLIRYINEAPFFELHTLEPEELKIASGGVNIKKKKVEEEKEEEGGKVASPGQVLGFADEETMALSKVIYEFLFNFQNEQ